MWYSLNAAARKLGVHPTTLRRWADEGAIPYMLTAGGHRRFGAAELEAFMQQHKHAHVAPLTDTWAERAMAETRKQIVLRQNDQWVAVFNAEEREQSRELGRKLMGILLQFISREDEAVDLLQEASSIGQMYAETLKSHNVALTEALQATFFFRDTLLETAVGLPETAAPRPEANLRLLRRINRLLNVVQLAIGKVYETSMLR